MDEITLEYELTLEEHLDYNMYMFDHTDLYKEIKARSKRLIAAIWTIGSLFILCLTAISLSNGGGLGSVISSVVTIAFFGLLGFFGVRFNRLAVKSNTRRLLDQELKNRPKGLAHVTLAPNEVRIKKGEETITFPWSSATTFADTGTAIILARGLNAGLYMPNRIFASPDERARVVNFIKIHYPPSVA